MRKTVLSLFLVGALGGLASPARAGDLFRAQSPWGGESADVYEDVEFGEEGYFEEGTGGRSWFSAPDYGTFFKAGVLWLSRDTRMTNQTLVVELPPLSTPLITTDTISLDNTFRPGAMFTLGFNYDQVSSIAFEYWGLQEWNNSAVATSTNFLGLAGTLQLATNDFIFANRMAVDYSSQMHNAEANYRQTIEGVTLLAGFRYFNLHENLDINSRSAFSGTSSDYTVSTQNQLVGGQLGVDWGFNWNRFHAGVGTKFGVFGNIASQNTWLGDFGNTFVRRDYRAESIPTSLLSETLVQTRYQVLDWLAIEGGYRFIWVQNVALAPDQLDLTDSPAGTEVMDPRGKLLLQGLNLGLEARW